MNSYKLYIQYSLWEPFRDYFLRIFFCHHNARVIADFEERMSSVIYAATNGRMSKAYYTKEVMISEIEDAFSEQYKEGYEDGKNDYKGQ